MYVCNQEAEALREENRRLIQRFFEVEHNSAEQLAMYAPDCQWEQPFFRPGEVDTLFPPEDASMPAPPDDLGDLEFTPEWHWGSTKIWGTDDPNYFFAENAGHGLQLTAEDTLAPYENYYFHTFQLRDGKIVYYREITNPINLMRTMGCQFEELPRPEETLEKIISVRRAKKESLK